MSHRKIERNTLAKNRTKLNRVARLQRWLAMERLESRNLLTGGFLQGTAFIDSNQNSALDPGEPFKVGATIELRTQAGTLITSTTTNANGQYRFDNLTPATYRLTEIPTAGYVNYGTQILAQINPAASPAVQISPSTIQVTVVNPDSIYINYLGVNPSLWEVVSQTTGASTADGSVGALRAQLGTAPGLSDLSSTFNTFCVDKFHTVTFEGGEKFQVLPGPASTSLQHNGNQVAYLYNHFGRNLVDSTGVPMTSITAAAFSIAVYELEYDPAPNDILTGFYRVNGPVAPFTSSSEYTQILAAANAFIAAAAGKSEEAVVLDATLGGQTVPQAGRQGMIATGSYNFANIPAAALGDFVFEDLNANGLQDLGEPGIPGVTVNLKDAGGTVINTTTTNGSGLYSFTNLTPGTYSVQFVQPGGYAVISPANVGSNDDIDSDGVIANALMTATTTLVSGQTDNSLDQGFYKPAALGDFVFEDLNANGLQDLGEPGIPGVTVNLKDAGGTVINTTTTNGSGLYSFTNLTPGTYSVQFIQPGGYAGISPANVGSNDDIDSDGVIANALMTATTTLVSGQTDNSLDQGFYKPAPPPQPGIDIEKTTNGSSNANSVTPDYDNEDAANGAGVPILTPGSDVTWTYKVTNTGNTTFTLSEISIVDDNGTPGNTADDLTVANGKVTFDSVAMGDGDNLLEPGEMWLYKATGIVQTLQGSSGSAVTMDFSGSSPLDDTDGNVRQFSTGGVSVKTTAFSREKGTNGQWSSAYLGSFGGGLGVTDSSEGNGSSDMHTVDNVGRDNYVLFVFDQDVIVDSTFLGYVVNDSDLQVWIGTISGAYSSLPTLSDSVLSNLGFTEVNSTTSSSPRTADINNGNVVGNVLIIAADTTDTSPEDRFKIEKVTVNKTSLGIYENKGVVTVPGGLTDSDLSHYKNPTAPPPQPGIDIEKTTNGSSNTNSVAPNYDNEDAANGAGVPKLTVGSDVTWTYQVTNTGNTTFTQSQVAITDDNGTPGNTADDMTVANGKITFHSVSTGDGDNLLEPGEVWLYKATGIVQTLQGSSGSATTINFSGSSSQNDTDGNVRQFSAGGVSVKTTAFSREKGNNGQWSSAYLGSYGGGLGITDSSEGDGSSNMHTVDNVGRDNYVLFVFDQDVIVDSTFLGYVVNDSDLQVWIGTINGAFSSLPTLSDSVLANLGFTEVNLASDGSTRTADINDENYAGNVLIIAADTTDTTPEDRFKIEKVTFSTTVQGIYENRGVVTIPGGITDSDLSHYKNNSKAPIAPSTKFYVVDASSDKTFAYGASGQSLTYNGLDSNNKDPRGAASTIAGDTVWVIDANKKVYVYDNVGTIQGSWTPKTKSGASLDTPEDITTFGSDIWIVDEGTNSVLKYSNAAGRKSGSQNATSSFNLNSSNGKATGIVTDGNYLWVVDNNSTDKVFKYTVNGSLLGSWTIDSANSSPTGITIDPANVSDIWIVDNGTDKVYQYIGATSFTGGSKSALKSFSLADDNTNPQGIADPPPVSRQIGDALSASGLRKTVGQFSAVGNSGITDRLDLADAGMVSPLDFYSNNAFSTPITLGVNQPLEKVSDPETELTESATKVAKPVSRRNPSELLMIVDEWSLYEREIKDLGTSRLEVQLDSIDEFFADFQ